MRHPDATESNELRAIAREAARIAEAPIAFLSLETPREGAPGNRRRLVVREGVPIEVTDAETEGVPHLAHHGARASLTVPLEVWGRVIGSLCVLDPAERSFSDSQRERLHELAKRASLRLAPLPALRTPSFPTLSDQALRPLFMELRNILQPLDGNVSLARIAADDIAGMLRFETAARENDGADREATRILRDASSDLAHCLESLEVTSAKLTSSVLALEKALLEADSAARFEDTIEAGSVLARHMTNLVGGVRWAPVPRGVSVQAPRGLVVAALSATLSEISDRLRHRGEGTGFDARVIDGEGDVEIRIACPGLADDEARACVTKLHRMLDPSGAVALRHEHGEITMSLLRELPRRAATR